MVMTRPSSGLGSERLAAAGRVTGSLRVFPPSVLLDAATRVPSSLRLVMRQPTTGGLLVAVFNHGRPAMIFTPADGRSLADLLAAAGAVDRETLDRLASARPDVSGPLHRLVIANTELDVEAVQRFLDYQARQRLLDALVWRDGFFEMEEYGAVEENEFTLALPSIGSLVTRAENRNERLPGLLASLPDSPANTLVKRRRGASGASNLLEDQILQLLRQPRLISSLTAQLLVDDDILIEAVLALAERDVVRFESRARLVERGHSDAGHDLRAENLVRDILAQARGESAVRQAATLWLVVSSASFALARSFVERLRSGDEYSAVQDRNGITSITLHPSADTSVCLMAVRSKALTRGALEGVMGRCDGVLLLRESDDADESTRLNGSCQELLAVRDGHERRPAILGLDCGARLRDWQLPTPDAVLGVPKPESMSSQALLTAVLEGVLAAVHGRASAMI